jgi:hypothetical protein
MHLYETKQKAPKGYYVELFGSHDNTGRLGANAKIEVVMTVIIPGQDVAPRTELMASLDDGNDCLLDGLDILRGSFY